MSIKYSFSQIQTYITCPERYFHQYIKKYKDHQSHYFWLAIHTTLADFYRYWLSFDDLRALFYSKKLSDIELQRWRKYLERYYPHAWSHVFGVEYHLSYHYDTFRHIAWTADLIQHDGTYTITDFKTSSKKSQSHHDQIILYAAALHKNLIYWRIVYFDHQDIEIFEITTEMIQECTQRYMDHIQNIEKDTLDYSFMTKPFSACEWSHCGYCPVYHLCSAKKDLHC